jgi:hypothetical protein
MDSSAKKPTMGSRLYTAILWLARIGVVLFASWTAYDIRLLAIKEYGTIIHE